MRQRRWSNSFTPKDPAGPSGWSVPDTHPGHAHASIGRGACLVLAIRYSLPRNAIAVHILVVEDERKVASFLRRGLEAEHHEVEVVHDGDAGLSRALATDYDLLILDVMLPRRDGLDVVRELRRQGRRMPILVLTARATLPDKVTGLDVGADD